MISTSTAPAANWSAQRGNKPLGPLAGGTFAMVRATMKVARGGLSGCWTGHCRSAKMMQVVCRQRGHVAHGEQDGSEVAACPLAEGIRRLRKF